MEGKKRKENHAVFHKSLLSSTLRAKADKGLWGSPLPRVFLLPLSVHIRNYMNSTCRIFFCEYHTMLMARLLHGIITYLERRHVVNKVKFWRHCLEVGKEVKESVIMTWGNEPTLQPCCSELALFFPLHEIYSAMMMHFQSSLQSKSKCHLPSYHLWTSWV